MSDTATELVALAHSALTNMLDSASTIADKPAWLEDLLVIRGALVDAFDRERNPAASALIWTAVDHLDLAVSLLGPLVPQLADEVAARRPVVDIPDSPLEG